MDIIANKKFIIIGLVAGLSLLILYFLILSVANSFSHAIEQFSQMWYWILLLTVGFGLQVGLYFFIKSSFCSARMIGSTTAIATSGGISAGSMVACCLHHLIDVLPLIGLVATAVFLAKYQLFFIIIGIFSNLIGVIIMLEIIQKYRLSEGFLKKILIYNMSKIKKIIIGISLILLLIIFFLINNQTNKDILTVATISSKVDSEPEVIEIETIKLSSKTNSQDGITFEVIPLDFNFDDPVRFEIKIDTHSGSLDFDMSKVSILEDDSGNQYKALNWQGSSPGGHHRSGVISFPRLDIQTKRLKLVIGSVSPRIFEWNLE